MCYPTDREMLEIHYVLGQFKSPVLSVGSYSFWKQCKIVFSAFQFNGCTSLGYTDFKINRIFFWNSYHIWISHVGLVVKNKFCVCECLLWLHYFIHVQGIINFTSLNYNKFHHKCLLMPLFYLQKFYKVYNQWPCYKQTYESQKSNSLKSLSYFHHIAIF